MRIDSQTINAVRIFKITNKMVRYIFFEGTKITTNKKIWIELSNSRSIALLREFFFVSSSVCLSNKGCRRLSGNGSKFHTLTYAVDQIRYVKAGSWKRKVLELTFLRRSGINWCKPVFPLNSFYGFFLLLVYDLLNESDR